MRSGSRELRERVLSPRYEGLVKDFAQQPRVGFDAGSIKHEIMLAAGEVSGKGAPRHFG